MALIIAYIRKNNRRYNLRFTNIIYKIRECINGIIVEKIDKGIIIIIPNSIKNDAIIKNKISNIIREKNIEYVVCENDLEKYVEEKEKILIGKIIMKNLVLKIYEYIFNIKKESILLNDVHILVNTYNKENIQLINEFTKLSRTVNIITENLQDFSKLEKRFEEQNIVITVSNNKRKSLKNAKTIINFDFSEKILYNYNINQYSIIINLTNYQLNNLKGFNGIIINNFEIIEDENFKKYVEEFYGHINLKLLYESYTINRMVNLDFKTLKINSIVGFHGPIDNSELIQLSKYYAIKK